MQIRRAQPDDAMRIAELHVLGWQHGYHGQLPKQLLDGLRPAQRLPLWTATLEQSASPGSAVILAEDGTELVGFAHLRPTRDRDHDPRAVGEITAFYVHPSRWRQGVGRQLMTACLHALAEAGYVRATLWVLDGNDRAIGFYQATGWSADGTIKHDDLAGTPIRDLRFQHSLAGANERQQSPPLG